MGKRKAGLGARSGDVVRFGMTRERFTSKAVSTLMAFVLAIGFLPSVAFADQEDRDESAIDRGALSEVQGRKMPTPSIVEEEAGGSAFSSSDSSHGTIRELNGDLLVPDFELKSVAGTTKSFQRDFGGRLRVVVMGRSTCENTVKVVKSLEQALSQSSRASVQGFILGVEEADQEAFTEKFKDADSDNLLYAVDGGRYRELFEEIYKQASFGSRTVTELPYFFLIDRDGAVRSVGTGLLSKQDISSCLDDLIASNADLQVSDNGEKASETFDAVGGVEAPTLTESEAYEEPVHENGAEEPDQRPDASIYSPDFVQPYGLTEGSGEGVAKETANEQRFNGFTYTVNGGEVTITGYEGTVPDLVIPSSIAGCPVTKISDFAFWTNGVIETAQIAGTVKRIGNYAFSECPKLKTAILEEGCEGAYSGLFADSKALESVYLPSTFTKFLGCMFNGCESLTSIQVSPDHPHYYSLDGDMYGRWGSLTFYAGGKPDKEVTVRKGIKDVWIGFSNAYHAETVNLINDVVSIDPAAISGPSIKTVRIGPKVTGIDFLFSGSSLTRFEVDSRNPSFCDSDGVLLSKNGSKLVTYPSGRKGASWKAPSTVATIGTDAFCSIDGPSEIVMSSKIESIDIVAFNKVVEAVLVFEKGLNPEGVSDEPFYKCDMTLVGDDSVKKVAEAHGQNYMTFSQYEELGVFALASVGIDSVSASYTGKPITPEVTVTLNGKRLQSGKDYSVDYARNVDAGTASVTLTGIGAYSGKKKLSFEILPIDRYKVKMDRDLYFPYTGKPIEPSISCTYNGMTLKQGKDYECTYSSNIDVGEGWMKVAFKGNYTGDMNLVFFIRPSSDSPEPEKPNKPDEPDKPTADVPKLSRLAGPIALDTMKSITTRGFAAGSCDSVVVATMDGYWDALTASSLAGLKKCPILLTDKGSLSSQTASEIKRLGASTVYIAGGTAAIAKGVENSISKLPGVKSVKRLAGATAIDTALKIYQQGKGSWGKTAVVATSSTFQDALSISPYAYAKKAPIFLSNASTHKLDGQVLSAIKNGGFSRVVIVGGTAAVSGQVENQLAGISTSRLAGATAYETSSAIADWCVSQGMKADKLGVATGESYYDALAGASLCGKNNAALVLVSDGNRSTVSSFIAPRKKSISHVYVFGGPAAVSEDTCDAVKAALKR
ncbi:hypothetical protein FIC87_09310 [Eggerthella lenta]|uniref:Uncharacterized protein n=1 Tax=Eggerthella lenta TaxID=84112 RepID=A0A5C5BUV2_EGGLN|nr:cell wall-binding repeat-containing protein [Eggerthella lenta]TNU90287.1 hypothetical protein FIC87_09310 [Eggerthella lenta]